MKKIFSAVSIAALIWVSPGLGLYEALAADLKTGRTVERVDLGGARGGILPADAPIGDAVVDIPVDIAEGTPLDLAVGETRTEPLRDAAISPQFHAEPGRVAAQAPAEHPRELILDRLAAAVHGQETVGTGIGESSRVVSAVFGERTAAEGAGPVVIRPSAAAGQNLGRSDDKEFYFKVTGIERTLEIRGLGATNHYEFKFSAILYKAVGLYFGGLAAGLGPIGSGALVAAYLLFYPVKGPAFLRIQSGVDMGVRTRLSRFPGFAGYWRLKGMENPRLMIASLPGVLEIVELVEQKDESLGLASFWGMFHNKRTLRHSYIVKADRDLSGAAVELPPAPSARARKWARAAEHAVESIVAGLNPYVAPTVALSGLQFMASFGLAPAFFLTLSVPIWLLWLAPAIAAPWFIMRQLGDKWPRSADKVRVERLAADAPVSLSVAKGEEDLGAVKETTVAEFMRRFLDAETTARVREKADSRWFNTAMGRFALHAVEAFIASLPFSSLDLVFHVHMHLGAAVWLTWFILREIGHKVHAGDLWRERTGFFGFLGAFWKAATKDKGLLINVRASGAFLGAVARGYGMRSLLSNGMGQQLKLLAPSFLLVMAPLGASIALGFAPAALGLAFVFAAVTLIAERGLKSPWFPAAFALLGLAFAAGLLPVAAGAAWTWSAIASVFIASRMVEARAKRLGMSRGPSDGMDTPVMRYNGPARQGKLKLPLGTVALTVSAVVAAIKIPVLLPVFPLMLVGLVLFGQMMGGPAAWVRDQSARVSFSTRRDPNRPDLLSSALSAVVLF